MFMIKKILCGIVLFSVFILCGCGKREELPDKLTVIKERGHLIVGVKYDTKPFGFVIFLRPRQAHKTHYYNIYISYEKDLDNMFSYIWNDCWFWFFKWKRNFCLFFTVWKTILFIYFSRFNTLFPSFLFFPYKTKKRKKISKTDCNYNDFYLHCVYSIYVCGT